MSTVSTTSTLNATIAAITLDTSVDTRARAASLLRWAALALLATALAGCGSLLGGKKEPATTYAPVARAQAQEAWPTVRWELAISRALGARGADSLRIAVRPTPAELQVYKGAQWAKSPSEMVEDAVLHTLEDSGRIAGVARLGSGLGADYRLLLDVRRFEADYAGGAMPAATIEVTAKLMHVPSQALVGSRTFLQARPAAGTAVPDVVAAFDAGLSQLAADLAGWTLTSGEAFERSGAGRDRARK
jgi:cholesterol transport system auxiliary component